MPPKKKEAPQQKVLLGRMKGNLKLGLVGLPNVGKSTTYNFISKQSVPAANLPFCTIDPHEARVNVPDERFVWLCDHYKPASMVPTNITIYDIAGLVPGAHEGAGVGNEFLSHIQAVDGILHVVRAFEDQEVSHTEGEVNPVADLKTISDELRLKDVQRCEALVAEKTRLRQRSKENHLIQELDTLTRTLAFLKDEEKWITQCDWKAADVDILNTYQFLTAKPVVYLVNMSQEDFIRKKNKFLVKIHNWIQENNPGPMITYSANFETSLAHLSKEEEKKEFMKSVGASKSMLESIISTGYTALDLIHYFTTGTDEVKCWTIRKGTKAPQAAGCIHSDMEAGFIRADVIKYADLKELGSDAKVKEMGKLQQKGKDYVVEDGDIIFVKFNPKGGGSGKK